MTPQEATQIIAARASGISRFTKEEQKANFAALRGKECKDCKHPPQPSKKRRRFQTQPAYVPSSIIEYPASRGGVGTELKLLFRRFGIVANMNCKCEQRAREMDSNGVEWCEEHIEEIVDWLEEEARNRCLPFLRMAGRLLVRRAIKNARKKLAILEQQK